MSYMRTMNIGRYAIIVDPQWSGWHWSVYKDAMPIAEGRKLTKRAAFREAQEYVANSITLGTIDHFLAQSQEVVWEITMEDPDDE